jgi:hypothetical protein
VDVALHFGHERVAIAGTPRQEVDPASHAITPDWDLAGSLEPRSAQANLGVGDEPRVDCIPLRGCAGAQRETHRGVEPDAQRVEHPRRLVQGDVRGNPPLGAADRGLRYAGAIRQVALRPVERPASLADRPGHERPEPALYRPGITASLFRFGVSPLHAAA